MITTEFRVPGSDFELGRVIDVPPSGTVDLELSVPTGGGVCPFFWLSDADAEPFATRVRNHPSTAYLERVASFEERTLFTFDLGSPCDLLFDGIHEHRGQVLAGTGTDDGWLFELRFPSHDALSGFQTHCDNARIRLTLDRIQTLERHDSGRPFGLTETQIDTLTRAVDAGYYDIPRTAGLREIADDLGVSDQAVSERLRRGVKALVVNALMSQAATVTQRH